MRKLVVLILAALVGVGGSLSLVAPAQAAAGVTIQTISSPTAPYGGKAEVKPKIKKSGSVKVKSATFTVTQGKKTVAKNKKSAKLSPGTYKVKTTATFQTKSKGKWSKTKTKTKTQNLTVKEGKKTCATKSDFDKVVLADENTIGDSVAQAAKKLSSNGKVDFRVTLGELEQDAIDTGDQDLYAEIQELYEAGYTSKTFYEFRSYANCADRKDPYVVVYFDGEAIDKFKGSEF